MPFLIGALARTPDAPALLHSGGILTYRELAVEAEEVARLLLGAGVGPGGVVALRGEVGPELLTLLHGIWLAGAAAAPLNPRWTDPETEEALAALAPGWVLEGAGSLPAGNPFGGRLPEPEQGAPAAHLLTSGTTGRPRVVGITEANLRASALGSLQRLSLSPSDRWLGSLSLSHVGGVALVTRAALLGSGVVLRGRFRAEDLRKLILRGEVTHASLVPTMLHQLLEIWGDNPPPATLRCLLLGGSPTPRALLERAQALGFPLAPTYGLTEATSQVATAPPELARRKPGTVGPPLPGVEVEIGKGEEILVRGATVAPGQTGEDGWLRTGDLGALDQEGHLWITGRISDRVISGGVNVDPGRVEGILQLHPGVAEVGVVGLPDPEWGERVVAVVVPVYPGAAPEGELQALARQALSSAHRPRGYRFEAVLPRNANGKVDREGLRALFR